jgi:2-polyprenyl-6-methoxyphenol hydroxylase-like FAD-dependent oxidoreductase
MTQRPLKALIIGAGIAGPTTGIFLKHAGLEPQIFEAWPRAAGLGGGLQIAPNGMHVLSEIGLAGEMTRRGSIAEAIEFYSQAGSHLGSINHNMAQRFGQPAVNMCRATLNDALLAEAQRNHIAVAFEKRLVKIDDRADQPIVAHFADGSSAEGDLLIGADGVHSAVRPHVVPDGPTPFDTGLIGFGGFLSRELLDRAGIGHRLVMTFGQSGFFGYGFCGPQPRDGAMWWSTQPGHGIDAETFRAMDQDALRRYLRKLHANWHDPIPGLLESIGDIVITPTLDVATLPAWSRERTVLIGDAAHATTPHAGQGASLALEDAMRLARLLAQGVAAQGRELGEAFAAFEQERRPRAERVVALARRNGNHKRQFGPATAWIRDRMLKIMIPVSARGQDWIYGYDPRAA